MLNIIEKYMVYKGYYWTRSLLKEAYLNKAFQGIQARRCRKEKPGSKTFRTAVNSKLAQEVILK
jgi:hypothetical protein